LASVPEPDAGIYLEHGLETDRAELRHLRRLIDETAATLVRACKGTTWPYTIDAAGGATGADSMSTDAMITFALAATAGKSLDSPLAPDPAEDRLGEETERAVGEADGDRDRAQTALAAILQPVVGKLAGQSVESGTYGRNDPFTLGWLLPLVAAYGVRWTRRNSAMSYRLKRAWEPDDAGQRSIFEPNEGKPLSHAFSLLRLIHLNEAARAAERRLASKFAPEFEAIVHRQIANSTIADAPFDAAELIFAFEGLLRTAAGPPSGTLTDRFFEVVARGQEHNPSWRPVRPFIGLETGMVLFPLSVESAASLARISRELDRPQQHESRFSRYVELFRKYVQWLEAQRVEISFDGTNLRGWHSEHVRESNTIYTWQTSQVLTFLLLYANLFERHIAARALAAANLSINRDPDRGPPPNASASWQLVWDTFLQKQGGVVGQTDNRSAVLYGPPGTGKTTLAEWLAKELDWPLITITPSDFMAQGTAAVEARAKAIFTALQEQWRAVVIFDEIDRLILDRDRPEYLTQEGAFQLMTPSMLTKLNELRKTGRVIFVVATNLAERIDKAIMRPGRFDEQLLILPPKRSERRAYLIREWGKKKEAAAPTVEESRLFVAMARRLELASYAELKPMVRKATSLADLQDRVARFEPTISIEGYAARMAVQSGDKKPVRSLRAEVLELRRLVTAKRLSTLGEEVVKVAERAEDTDDTT
jgi:hypothetical protein